MKKEEFDMLKAGTLATHNLNTNAVSRMNGTELLNQFQGLSDKIAARNNMIPAEVLAQPLAPNVCAFQSGTSIVMNKDMLMPELLENKTELLNQIDSIGHENSHLRDLEASIFNSVRENMTPEEIAELDARLETIPDDSWDLYYNHPAEIAAREFAAKTVSYFQRDQELFSEVDAELNGGRNQILATYDFAIVDGQVVYEDTFDSSEIHNQDTLSIDGMQTFSEEDGMINSGVELSEAAEDFDFSSVEDDA